MAKQHFYSRVPFRMSMFNKADGYDTFACSEGVDREFIEKELMLVCEPKPTPEDIALMRENKIPPVYCQFAAKDGSLVQSCMTSYPLDYTGERSAYMVHNIIFSDQEAESFFHTPDRAPMNPDMFDHDIGHFNITAPNAKPLSKYPLIDYKCLPAESPAWLVGTYQENIAMLQRLIYACAAAACGAVKSVFVLLPENDAATAIRYFNTLYSVLPYHLRPQLSFITRVSDISRYQSIKLKFLSGAVVVPNAKGVMINFRSNPMQFTGMKDEDVQKNAQVVEFLYTLMTNDAIRREFLIFADRAVKEVPKLGEAKFQALQDLVFLFRCSSGLFEERTVLPTDDKLIEFFTGYDKYRAALPNDYRMNAVKSLQRYPASHTAIPPKLFSKLSKIYPTDTPGVRHVIMSVVLELIHMDIMRDKLFDFTSKNYQGQDPDSKDEIVSNLSRVFYGGFLQQKILLFFEQIFLDASPASQDEIMEKLLLSIRNKDVKEKILDFLKTNFKGFSPDIRHRVYSAAFEHIQEGDELAAELLALVDANLPAESEEEQIWFDQKLANAVKNEQRKKTHPLLRMLAVNSGRCAEMVLARVYGGEFGSKAFNEAISCFCAGSIKDMTAGLERALPFLPAINEDMRAHLYEAIAEATASSERKPDLLAALGAEQIAGECLKNAGEDSDEAIFWNEYSDRFISPAIIKALPDVFRYVDQPEFFDRIYAYAEQRPPVKASDGFQLLLNYRLFCDETGSSNVPGMLSAFAAMPITPAVQKPLALYMKKNLLDAGAAQTPEAKTALLALINSVKGGYDFPTVYDALKQKDETEEAPADAAKKKKGPDDSAVTAIRLILSFCAAVMSSGTDEQREMLYADSSSLNAVFNSFMGQKKNGEQKLLTQEIDAVSPQNSAFAEKAKNMLKAAPKQKSNPFASISNIFGNLFKKKK